MKYLSLDFYEERKWKKACGYIFAQSIKKEKQKKEEIKKIITLYKKVYSLYITVNQNYNISELLIYNNNDRLNDYLHTNYSNNIENLHKDLCYWKKQMKDFQNEIKESIELDNKMNNNFSNVFSVIKNIEEKNKIINKNINNNKNNKNNIQYNDDDVLNDFDTLSKQQNNFNYQEIQIYNIIPNEFDIIPNEFDINYNEINLNLKNIINQIDDKLYNDMIKIEIVKINNSITIKEKIAGINNNNHKLLNHLDFDNNNLNNISLEKLYLRDKDIEKDSKEYLNNELNPTSLVLEISNEVSHKNIVEYFKKKSNFGCCFSMPIFNFEKIINNKYNLNNLEFDKKNVYFKIFPIIENDENKLLSKKLISGLESQNNNTKNNIISSEQTTRYIYLTPLQKVVILYGIFITGNNHFLVNFILNAYFPTRCLKYNYNEMKLITKNILDEIGIEYESNFTYINYEIFNNKYNHYLGSSQTDVIESVFNNYECNEFTYINIIKKIVKNKIINDKNEYYKFLYSKIKETKKNNFNIKNKNVSINKSLLLMNIIMHNPYILNKQIKKIFLKSVINYLIQLCKTIKDIKEDNINKSKFNYFTGIIIKNNQKKVNDINYKEIKENKKKQLNKNNILKALRDNKNEFKTYSIKKYKEKLKTNNIKINYNVENNSKIKILEIVNKYSDYNFKNEWKSMKNFWYQNNNKLNPFFKFRNPNTDVIKNKSENNFYILNKYNKGGKDETIEFGSIINLKINQ